MSDLRPDEPVQRYERDSPGELLHIDIKKLGRFDKVGHRITGDPARVKVVVASVMQLSAEYVKRRPTC